MAPRKFDHDECRRISREMGWSIRRLGQYFGVSHRAIWDALNPDKADEIRSKYRRKTAHLRRVAERYGIRLEEARKMLSDDPGIIYRDEGVHERVCRRLFEGLGKYVSIEQLSQAAYWDRPNGAPSTWKACVRRIVCHLRPRLLSRGLVVDRGYGEGYRLVRIEEYREAA